MKISDARGAYYEFSGKVSEASEKFALAAIAIAWLYASSNDSVGPRDVQFDGGFRVALIAALTVLAAGFLQYAVQTVIWGTFARRKELSGLGADEEFKAPRQLNWFPLAMFVVKVGGVIVSYVSLLSAVGPGAL